MDFELPDMWPKEIGQEDQTITPAAILKTAASQLGLKTQQLVAAEVSTNVSGETVYNYFSIVVPALDNYRYRLFTVRHQIISIFPAFGDEPYKPDVKLENAESLKKWLQGVLGSERTITIINSLLAQVRN